MKITQKRLKQIIKEELDSVDEGLENVTPENIQIALEALKQIAVNFSPALAAAIAAGTYAGLKDKLSKPANIVGAPEHAGQFIEEPDGQRMYAKNKK